MFSKILNADDGSDQAFEALLLAIEVAKQNGAELHMVCVEEIPRCPNILRKSVLVVK
jgi:nucleotide-binding universal stress UspA family protein